MKDLFKNLWDKISCQKNGVCSLNPILNAIDAVIINEIRQIAFYVIRLKEFNLINNEIMKETVFALSIKVTDTDFDKKSLFEFFENLKNTKNKIKEFYLEKCREMHVSYEFITPLFSEETDDINSTALIKSGENLIKQFYSFLNEEKSRLITLIFLTCRMSAQNLVKLSSFKENLFDYYFEILRLMSLTNYAGTREEKFIRRIKEFSEIAYQIQSELDFEQQKAYGKRENSTIDTNIYKGKSILVSGGDLDELDKLLEKIEDINVYINSSLILACSYPKFTQNKNFKGVFGSSDVEYDFSKFAGGPIFVTRNSQRSLDTAFRGKIFTSKLIPNSKFIKIENNDFAPLIEEAKNSNGFLNDIKNEEIEFDFELEKIEKTIENSKDKKILIAIGSLSDKMKEKFPNHTIINFIYPYETEGLHFVINRCKKESTTVLFSDCAPIVINSIVSLLNKDLEGIYLDVCESANINPHAIEALQKDFSVKII